MCQCRVCLQDMHSSINGDTCFRCSMNAYLAPGDYSCKPCDDSVWNTENLYKVHSDEIEKPVVYDLNLFEDCKACGLFNCHLLFAGMLNEDERYEYFDISRQLSEQLIPAGFELLNEKTVLTLTLEDVERSQLLNDRLCELRRPFVNRECLACEYTWREYL